MADDTLCEVLGLGMLVHLVVEELSSSSWGECFHGGLLPNLTYGCREISLFLLMSFFEKFKDQILASVVDYTF